MNNITIFITEYNGAITNDLYKLAITKAIEYENVDFICSNTKSMDIAREKFGPFSNNIQCHSINFLHAYNGSDTHIVIINQLCKDDINKLQDIIDDGFKELFIAVGQNVLDLFNKVDTDKFKKENELLHNKITQFNMALKNIQDS